MWEDDKFLLEFLNENLLGENNWQLGLFARLVGLFPLLYYVMWATLFSDVEDVMMIIIIQLWFSLELAASVDDDDDYCNGDGRGSFLA